MKTIEHVIWAVALVVCVTLIVFRPQAPVAPIGPPAVADKSTQTLARTVQGLITAVRDAQAVRNGPAAFNAGIPAATYAWLAGLGKTPTVTVYSAAYKPPTPAPVPTLQPNSFLPANFAQWHHADTVAATEEALKKTPINLQVSQQPVAPNRVGAIYLSDGATGATYAIARRGQLDLDLGAANGGTGLEALAGYGYNIKNTSAGLFIGVTVGKAPGLQRGIGAGVRAGLVVHP